MLIPGGLPFVGGAPIGPLADAVRMELLGVERLGPDARLTWALQRRSS
jgi:hypothetical protein